MPEPIEVAEPRPKPPLPLPEEVIVTTAGLAAAAIPTIGWFALPLAVGTMVLVLVSSAGALEVTGVAAGRVSSTTPNVPPAASAAARIAVRTTGPRPIPFPLDRPPADCAGGTATGGGAA